MRLLILVLLISLAGCSDPSPAPIATVDPTSKPEYGRTVTQLQQVAQQATQLFEAGQGDQAAALIGQGMALQNRVLAVSRPTKEAVEAASDLDEIYGRMLLSNKHYGDARMLFQKDRIRWKNWQPQTAETERRRKVAESRMAECDKAMEQ